METEHTATGLAVPGHTATQNTAPRDANSKTASSKQGEPSFRKIIHIDMDAFYASVEQRDNPELRCRTALSAGRGLCGQLRSASVWYSFRDAIAQRGATLLAFNLYQASLRSIQGRFRAN